MSEDSSGGGAAAPAVSQGQLQKAEAYVEAEEGVVNRLVGWAGRLVTSIAVAMSLFHLYAAIAGAWPFTDFPIITTQPLRYAHVAFVLILSFLLFPLSERFRDRIRWWDIAAGVLGAAILVYAIEGGEEFTDRATMPTQLDVVLGVIFIILLLEATRRTNRLDRSIRCAVVHRLCHGRSLSAAAVDAPRLRRFPTRRPFVHHA